jgi:hypothetical protein
MARVCRNCGFLNEQLEIDAHPLIPGAVSNDPWRQLADLDSSMTHLQSLLLQLQHKRATVKREINARVAPILKLPPELSSWHISNSDLIECLRAAPSIHTLSLTRLTGPTLRILDPHISATPALLPNLKVFRYDGSFDFIDLTTILRSRWESAKSLCIAKLQSAKISTQDHGVPDDPTLVQLQPLVEDGMTITLVTADDCWTSVWIP